MAGRLTKAHIDALPLTASKPYWGFPAGSNLWPLTVLDKKGVAVDGEVVDELLRAGLLVAVPKGEVHAGQRSPDTDIIPDLEFEHEIRITPAGRAALQQEGKGNG